MVVQRNEMLRSERVQTSLLTLLKILQGCCKSSLNFFFNLIFLDFFILHYRSMSLECPRRLFLVRAFPSNMSCLVTYKAKTLLELPVLVFLRQPRSIHIHSIGITYGLARGWIGLINIGSPRSRSVGTQLQPACFKVQRILNQLLKIL